MKKFILIIFVLLINSHLSFSQTQTEKDKALKLVKKAIELVDDKEFNDGLKLLFEARKLDSNNIAIIYEIGLAYCKKGQYQKAIDIIEPYKFYNDFDAQYFQLLGNCYDMVGKSEKAMVIYSQGISLSPHAGRLYLEMGNVELERKNVDSAVHLYEKGVEVDPMHSSNYYWLAKIFCATGLKVWGLIYGELFMNLERSSKRTEEISKLLYDTYEKGFTVKNKNEISVHFFNIIQVGKNVLESSKFGMNYEMCLSLCFAASNKKKDLENFHAIREEFINQWYKKHFNDTFPNVLIDWQKSLKDKGYLKYYDYWLLAKGNEDEFEDFIKDNPEKMSNFIYWFRDNPLELDTDNCFYRKQYDWIEKYLSQWKTDEDFKSFEPQIINYINWLEVNPLPANEEQQKKINAIVLLWFINNKNIQLNINAKFVYGAESKDKTYKYIGDLLMSYMFGKGLYLIEHQNSEDGYQADLRGVNAMITSYKLILREKPDAVSNIMEMYIKMQEQNTLEDYVKELSSKPD